MGLWLKGLNKSFDTLRGLQALIFVGDEGNAYKIRAGVHAMCLAREETAGENRHILVAVQGLREIGIRNRGRHPVVKRRIGHVYC